jgi:1-acyl-sn-glycerol-3-phosphate acyltransferase
LSFSLLVTVKVIARLFFRVDLRWVGEVPDDPWGRLRLVAFLNHTSLWEPLFVGGVPLRFLRRLAAQGVVPAAEVTLRRPLVGRFFRLVARDVVPISRRRDDTWQEVLRRVGPDSMLMLAPEGRMKRANGLDKDGKRMTVRGGIADLIEAIPDGFMILAYSGGLHHVQVPGQRLPRPFHTIRIGLEALDLSEYRKDVLGNRDVAERKQAVIRDLESRRDHYCPLVADGSALTLPPAQGT